MEAFVLAPWISFIFFLSLIPFFSNPSMVSGGLVPTSSANQQQTYIIQVEKSTQTLDEDSLQLWYESFLPESVDDKSQRMLHSYSHVFNGFSAKLTEDELQELSSKEGFLRAFPNRVLRPLTTRTPEFLGLEVGQGLWKRSNLGKGVIIGLLDTGVTPGHPSFHDHGVPPPPPPKWKGSCHFPSGCNNKLIGAKNMIKSSVSPIDTVGHGTHTASTAAGNLVQNVSIDGLASGTAAGMAPLAHLAMYKVCDEQGCDAQVILAGLDAAVKDGVDVISVSLGGGSFPYDRDPLAIGAFGAVEEGVFVSFAAGNDGPNAFSLSNDAPWMLTVAASTFDRSLRATVKLGNGSVFKGESVDQQSSFSRRSHPLHYSIGCDSLTGEDVKGKVVLCGVYSDPKLMGSVVKAAGGVGTVLIDELGFDTLPDLKVDFPAAIVTEHAGDIMADYAQSSQNPTVSILFNGTILGVSPSPTMVSFSSRGPSIQAPGIIKPDISGPGVNVLAGWIKEQGGNGFQFVSGTSMATPHLSGIAALVKSVHPEWSPAAIRSAIMTTSKHNYRDGKPIIDEFKRPASFFKMGAGNVHPPLAANPGLVYDLSNDDYAAYICGKFPGVGARLILGNSSVNCSAIKTISEAELNYPSILLTPQSGATATVPRTVTNVGAANSTYAVEVSVPKTVKVTVEPRTLVFSKVGDKKTFTVTAKWVGGTAPERTAFVEGNLKWVSGDLVVRSPIVVAAK